MKALLVIDVQNGLTRKRTLYNENVFFQALNDAIQECRNLGYPVFFCQHNNHLLVDGNYDWKIDNRLIVTGSDTLIQKQHCNAFKDTVLNSDLKEKSIDEILVCGIVSHGCIKATCLGGLKEGYRVCLLKNGHTNWDKNAEEKIAKTEKELESSGVIVVELPKRAIL
jgi:nicotinamidase-related amidase